jgi:hypothetical protein
VNVCGACGLDFGSVRAFDAHRVGVHAYTYPEGLRMTPPRDNGRRCLTSDELSALPGFARNARGRWSLAAHQNRGFGRS